jgi:hypothetical protein
MFTFMFPWQGWVLSADATDCTVVCITVGLGLIFVVYQLMQPLSHLQQLLATLCYIEHRNSYNFAVCEVQ